MLSSPGVVPVLVVLVHDVVHPVHQIGQQETVRPTDKSYGAVLILASPHNAQLTLERNRVYFISTSFLFSTYF
jgi:hypothetical protein